MNKNRGGFSLVELIVATSIIVILSLAAVSIGDLINQRDREVRLRQSLLDMRSAIDRYRTIKKGALPSSMELLRAAKDSEGFPYLRRVPDNPVASMPGPYWEVATRTYDDPALTNWFVLSGTVTAGIADIRCPDGIGTGLNGFAYETW